MTAAREIKLLKLLDHENIIKIVDIVSAPDGVSLVFPYYQHDLSGLLQHPGIKLEPGHLKHLLMKVLRAVEYLHGRRVAHRDLKTSNVLVGGGGEVMLADFGLAKSCLHPDITSDANNTTRMMTNRVVTLWYRAPELLLGATEYGPEVDMWSLGCILVELFTRKPLFQSNSELSQIDTIFKRYTLEQRKALDSFPWAGLVDLSKIPQDKILIEELLAGKEMPSDALDLAKLLLSLDPSKRPTASQALRHPFFTNNPPPRSDIPSLEGDWHEYECKQRRRDNADPK